MRPALVLIAGLLALGGCGGTSRDAPPPTVSYPVAADDLAQANIDASAFCRRYDRTAQFEGVQQTPSGGVARYSCADAMAISGGVAVPALDPRPYGAPVAPAEKCSDPLNLNRPGGLDYFGPPVPGCTASP